MEANEAPKKIYVNFHFTETHPGYSPYVTKQGLNKYDVVYVRTDAFIEKATEWLGPVFKDLVGYYSGAELLDDFKNYMKGE